LVPELYYAADITILIKEVIWPDGVSQNWVSMVEEIVKHQTEAFHCLFFSEYLDNDVVLRLSTCTPSPHTFIAVKTPRLRIRKFQMLRYAETTTITAIDLTDHDSGFLRGGRKSAYGTNKEGLRLLSKVCEDVLVQATDGF
jgi:hypothetical protein